MVTVAMTVLPCACGGRLTRASLGGRAPGPTPPRRVVPPLPPTRPGGGSASRKAGGAWCPRRPAALRPLGWEGPRPWRPKGRPGAPWRRAPPGPRVRTREVSRRPPTRDNRLDPQATACATVSHGTDLPASRRGNPGSGAVSRASPRRPPPLLPPPRPRSWSWPMRGAGRRPGLHSRRRRRGRPQGSRDRGARPAAPPQPGVMSAASPSPVPNGSRRAPRSPVPRASRRTARGAPRRAPGCARDGGTRCAPGPVRDGGGGGCAHDSRLGRGGGPRTPVARALWTAPSPPSAVEPGAPPRAAHRPGPGPGPGRREERRGATG